jgi:ABC-2 type transport system ATP-binding protein
VQAHVIQALDLTKRYGSTLALDRLTVTIPEGSVFGLLGPNGSGKSTFIKLLLGLIFADAGKVERGGIAAHQFGYLPERPALPPRSRVAEVVELAGQLSGLRGRRLRSTVDQHLVQVGLSRMAGARIGTCSKGMLQRLGLAVALVADPPVVVLDEPMEGLDPAWQKTVRDLMVELNRQGKTVVLSTHRLSDVAQVCSHVCILARGQLRRAGALDSVLPPRQQVIIGVDRLSESLQASLASLHPRVRVRPTSVALSGDALAYKADVLGTLLSAGVDIQDLTQQRLSLEEVYLEAVGA